MGLVSSCFVYMNPYLSLTFLFFFMCLNESNKEFLMEKESARSHALFTSVKMISSFRFFCKLRAWCPPTHPFISFICHLYSIQSCNLTSHQLVFSGCTACSLFVLFIWSCYPLQGIAWHYDNDAKKKKKCEMLAYSFTFFL